ncbi:MAG TPA: hypothetical protein VFR49_12895, partial [Solirubrobacteraceae bacterium]|nr:hypothetical protein [Solirubrobacteraceae bacterium]
IALQQVVDEGKLPAGPEGGAAQAEANGGEPAEPEAEGDTQVAAEAGDQTTDTNTPDASAEADQSAETKED